MTPDRTLTDAARAVCDLFGDDGWPHIEVLTDPSNLHDRATLPLSDDDADKVRALRRVLRGMP